MGCVKEFCYLHLVSDTTLEKTHTNHTTSYYYRVGRMTARATDVRVHNILIPSVVSTLLIYNHITFLRYFIATVCIGFNGVPFGIGAVMVFHGPVKEYKIRKSFGLLPTRSSYLIDVGVVRALLACLASYISFPQ